MSHKTTLRTKLSVLLIRLLLYYLVLPMVRLLWVKQVDGLDKIPASGAAIIAFNHQSYFDFIGFVAVCPRPIHYLAAEKFYTKETHAMWGPIMEAMRQIRVDRKAGDKDDVYKGVYAQLAAGELVGIFPEGTRAPSNTEMLRAYPGVARFAHTANVPIIPVGIRGAYEIMSRHDKRPRFKKVLEFHIGVPFSGAEIKNYTESTLQELADSVMRRISLLANKPYPYE